MILLNLNIVYVAVTSLVPSFWTLSRYLFMFALNLVHEFILLLWYIVGQSIVNFVYYFFI